MFDFAKLLESYLEGAITFEELRNKIAAEISLLSNFGDLYRAIEILNDNLTELEGE